MYQKTLSVFLVLLAMVFIGTGITGFATIDNTEGYCLDDSNCKYSVCCALVNQDYGICAQESECAAIYSASRSQAPSLGAPESETLEQATHSYVAVALGVVLLLIIAIVSYVEWTEKPVTKKKSFRRKKKK